MLSTAKYLQIKYTVKQHVKTDKRPQKKHVYFSWLLLISNLIFIPPYYKDQSSRAQKGGLNTCSTVLLFT